MVIKMNRKEFLEICQKNSATILEKRMVKFGNAEYYPLGYKLTFDNKGNPLHTAILKDMNANCIVECRLDAVS